MKYLVAVKYVKSEGLDSKIFEFSSKKARSSFVDEIRPMVLDIIFSEMEENKD